MSDTLDKHVLSNGMVVLGEPMDQVESAAFTFLVPSGASVLPDGCCGAGNVIVDWIFRGAGSRDSRGLIEALDGLGVHRNSSVGNSNISLGAAMVAGCLHDTLDIYADVILRPTLDNDQFELSRQLAMHELIGLDDDPRQKVMLLLREQFYPDPLGRPATGKITELQALTSGQGASIIKSKFCPADTIFAVAGKYDFSAVCEQLEGLLGGSIERVESTIEVGERGEDYLHVQHEGAQVHIGIMTQTTPITSDDYYNAMAAVSVLSGGMSSRLFTEVREKRGLCYAVGARYHTLKDRAGICCYAGTTPDKAQETLDVTTEQFENLHNGISEDEIHRAKVGLKSTLIMQSESTSSRAGGIASDYYLLGQVRPLSEIKDKLEELSVDSVVEFLNNNRFTDYTVVTIGPKQVVTGG